MIIVRFTASTPRQGFISGKTNSTFHRAAGGRCDRYVQQVIDGATSIWCGLNLPLPLCLPGCFLRCIDLCHGFADLRCVQLFLFHLHSHIQYLSHSIHLYLYFKFPCRSYRGCSRT